MYKPKFAYAIWPWGLETKEQMIQALKDVKEAGFTAFESVESAVDLFQNNVKEFKDIIAEHGVYPVSFYFWQNGDETHDIGNVERKIEFLVANGVQRMSVQAPQTDGSPTSMENLKRVLKTIEKIGIITKQYNVTPCIHPHHNTMIMYENEIDFIMQNTDPEYIGFGPDTAHLATAGCNPVEIFKRYIDRIQFVHLKDLKEDVELESTGNTGFDVYNNFMELGQGDIDLKGVFKVLKDHKCDAYMTVELDRTRFTSKESAKISRKYLDENF